MNIEELREFCLQKQGVSEGFPFYNDVLVFKVCGKVFALTSLAKWEEGQPAVNLKCEPEKAVKLRQEFSAIQPGFHMNKKHWNTVQIDGSLPDDFLQEMITDSYKLVVQKLPKKHQKELEIR